MMGTTVLSRLALTVGGLTAVLLTPVFALSYFLAYGLPQEAPPGWLAHLQEPLTNAGLLDGSTAAYDRYGLFYCAAWILALAGLGGLLRPVWGTFTARLRRAWVVVITGLGVVAVGVFGDYAPASDLVGGVGFVLTGVGFLVAAVGCGLLGWALLRDRGAKPVTALGVGALGVVSMVGGLALVGHIPSGPGLGWVVGAIVLGLVRPRHTGPGPMRGRFPAPGQRTILPSEHRSTRG